MNEYSYHFEQVDLLNLFVSAFDDAFVYRYDAITREPKERIDVRYVFGPKHRVLRDLNDRAKTLTLPVVTVQQMNVSRASNRVFNKGKYITRLNVDGTGISKMPMPVPVDIEVDVSVICKFKEDLDQILQNFITQCNPYIIVSWKVPESYGMDYIDEIRTEIQWSGDAPITSPDSLNADEKWRISADTSFTIKGWLFPPTQNLQAPIYFINNEFKAASKIYDFDDYNLLSAYSINTDTIVVSATPSITNTFYVYDGLRHPIYETIVIEYGNHNKFLIYGDMFDRNNTFYLSSGDLDFYTNYEAVSTATSPIISAFRLPSDSVYVQSDEIVSITLSANTLSTAAPFTIIIANEAGWVSTSQYTLVNQISSIEEPVNIQYGVLVDPDGNYIVDTSGNYTIALSSTGLSSDPNGVLVDPDGNYIVDPDGNYVATLSSTGLSGLLVDPDGNYIVDPDGNRVVALSSTGLSGALIDPDGNYMIDPDGNYVIEPS